MKRFFNRGISVLAAALMAMALIGTAQANDTENAKAKKAGAVTALWDIHQDDNTALLLPQGKNEPVRVQISPTTVLAGICHDCHLFQQFKASESKVICDTCACGNANVQCVAWKPVKPATWEKMLEALPRGVALRVTYNESGNPESGLKTLTIDRRTVLVPVEGMSGKSPDELLTLFKPLGAEKVQWVGDGKQLLIDLKEDWTLERAARFENVLVNAGGRIVPNEMKDSGASKKPNHNL